MYNILKPMDELNDEIDGLVIIKGRLSTDQTIYEFHIGENKIRVDSEKMDSPREFRKQYQKVMFKPAVRLKNEEWDCFLWNFVDKTTFIEVIEESDAVFKAREIFAKICELPVSTDQDDVAAGRALYDYEGFYYLPSKKIKEIVDVENYRIPFNTLSTAMTELHLKKEGTDVVRLRGHTTRCWGFIPSEVNQK